MNSHLYLLHHAFEPRFKIGKANTPADRARTLGLVNRLDLSRSHQVALPAKRVFEVERFLHRTLADSSLDRPPEDGYTEWFDADAYDRAMRYLAFIADEDGSSIRELEIPVAAVKPGYPECPAARQARGQREPFKISRDAVKGLLAFADECSDLLFIFHHDGAIRIGFRAESETEQNRLLAWFWSVPMEGESDADFARRLPQFVVSIARGARVSVAVLTGFDMVNVPASNVTAGYISFSAYRQNEQRHVTRFRRTLLRAIQERVPRTVSIDQTHCGERVTTALASRKFSESGRSAAHFPDPQIITPPEGGVII